MTLNFGEGYYDDFETVEFFLENGVDPNIALFEDYIDYYTEGYGGEPYLYVEEIEAVLEEAGR